MQQLVLEVAANKRAAREKIAGLKREYTELLREVSPEFARETLKEKGDKLMSM